MATLKTSLPNLFVALLLSLVFALGMALLLNYYKFSNTVSSLVRGNVAVAAQDIQESFRLSLSLGLDLSAIEGMPALLVRQSKIDPSIIVIRIGDMKGRGLYASDPSMATEAYPEAWTFAAKASKNGEWSIRNLDGVESIGWVLRNNFGLAIGLLAIEYSTSQVEASQKSLFPALIKTTLWVFGVALILGSFFLVLLCHFGRNFERLTFRASLLIMLVTLGGLLAVSLQALPLFEQHLLPKLEQNARQNGQIKAGLIGRAMAHGLALEELYGVEDVLRRDLAENVGLAYFSVLDHAGGLVFHVLKDRLTDHDKSNNVVPPIVLPIGEAGSIHIGLDAAFAGNLLKEMSLDVLVVLVVAMFFTLEVLAFLPVSGDRSCDPLRKSRDIRAPAFLFFLSEELTRPFLPAFVGGLSSDFDLSLQNIVIGFPIMVFMLVVALAQPWLGGLSQKIGNRRLLLGGSVIAIGGFLVCAMATNIYTFVAARMICALGYAAIFVSAQGHILENTADSSRSAGFALFVGAIMVATICGPSIGGILADNIGARATFVVAAGIAALGIPLMFRLSGGKTKQMGSATGSVRIADVLKLCRNRRFVAVCVSAAIPAKVLLTGCCFFLLPLYIVSIGSTQSMAGRMLMVYASFMVLIMPVAARYADHFNARAVFILSGLLISAIGGMLALITDGFLLAIGLVIALGIGQSLSITAQSTLVSSVASSEIESFGDGYVYGVYRLIERMGNALGPLLAGVLLTLFGFQVTFVCMGVLALLAATGFYWLIIRPVAPNVGAA
jgi:predicted MFS family arabinose efflux permease